MKLDTILGVDTSAEDLVVILERQGKIFESRRRAGLRHSESLMPLIDRLLADAGGKASDLDLLVCTRGPGSFTGLRIGMSTLKGLSSALGIPLVSLPTLDILAGPEALWPGGTLPVLDARKKRIYTAFYQGGEKRSPPWDIPASEIPDRIAPLRNQPLVPREERHPLLLTGPHAELAAAALDQCPEPLPYILSPARHLSRGPYLLEEGRRRFLTQGADPEDSHPIYLRKSEAEITLERREKK